MPVPRQVQALRAVASAPDATSAAASLGVSLTVLAQDLTAAREHYGVSSTRAAWREASRLGHLSLHDLAASDW